MGKVRGISDRAEGNRLSELRKLDVAVLRLARTRAHSPAAERAVAGFSGLGEYGAVWLVIGCVGQLIDGKRRGRWRRATRTLVGTYTLNTALKLLIRRSRPALADLPPLTGTPTKLSFPSAHASTSFAAAGLYRRLDLPALPLYALASSLALSRLYLGVHYPSDVLAGALLGQGVVASVALAHPLPGDVAL